MSLFDSVLGAVSGKTDGKMQPSPLIAIVGALLAQSGGLEGLMKKFSQAGLGDVFSKWVEKGPNPPVSASHIQQVFGADQIQALAAKLGIDPTTASEAMAEHLPSVVDRLTPEGEIDPNANFEEGLSALIPSLLSKLTGSTNG